MKAIVGSAGVPLTTDVISTIVGLIAMDSDSIAVRGPANPATVASPIEELAMSLGSKVGRDVVVWRTAKGEPSPARDRHLVGNVQRVYAFFQMVLPALGFLVATAVPALIFRRRRALRV